MRRLYREQLIERIRRGNLGWLLHKATRYALVRLGRRVGHPVAGPILGTLITNYSCNLRCVMCDLPLRVSRYRDEGHQPLSTEETLAVIDDFAAIGTLGLGFTGGEPMLRKDLFELLERSREHGLITHLNTNGTFLDADAARRLVALGIDSVNLSLDGATAATHDRIRGKEGSFDEVLAAAAHINRCRKGQSCSRLRLKLVLAVGPDNVREALELLRIRKEIGADSVDYIPVHDFDQPGSTRPRPVNGSFGDGSAQRKPRPEPDGEFIRGADHFLRELASRLDDEPVDNSPGHVDLMHRAFRGEPNPIRCSAAYNSCAVDLYGRIFPCVPWSNADRPVGNVREIPLARFWKSQQYQHRRKEVDTCRDCYLNCQTELNLLFDGPAPAPPGAARG